MIVFSKNDKKNVLPTGFRIIEFQVHYLMHLPLRFQGLIQICQNDLIEKNLFKSN